MPKSDETRIIFPLVESVVGFEFPARRLAKLAGAAIAAENVIFQNGKNQALIYVSQIVQSLVDSPERFYWQGYLNAQQPGSYGICQDVVIDPALLIEVAEFAKTDS